MADYIYLLETRLTPAQLTALRRVQDVARAAGTTLFLVGGAVRDLTAGFSVRDLDFAVQSDASRLKKPLQQAGFTVVGEYGPTQSLFLTYPGGVRLEIGATLSASYPKPGKPVYSPATILDDLRRRDFTANAMAVSLNEGSYGLLMDPLNGVADIENMELRLVSNYGFIEDPALLIRAARLSARLGWHLEERTQARYETGKQEDYIANLPAWYRGYETEEVFHEEDPLRVLRRLESEGWAQSLFPAWTSAKANENELNRLRDVAGQLQGAGIHADPSAAYFPLLTAKLSPAEVTELKKLFPRQGFVAEVEALEGNTKAFAAEFSGKAAAAPSAAWKMLLGAAPEQVLWLAYSSKSPAVQARFKAFFQDWPRARQRVPYATMQEMRITPDLPGYAELVERLFFAFMDQELETPEAVKAFLEPYSPPAPPPPPNLRRRPAKRESKASRKKAAAASAVPEEVSLEAGDELPSTSAPAEAPVPPAAPEKKPAEKKESEKKAALKKQPEAKAAAAPAKQSAPVKQSAPDKSPAKAAGKAPAAPAKASQKPAATVKAAPAKVKSAKPAKAAAPARKSASATPKPAKAAATKKAVAKKAPARPAPKPAKKAVPAKKQPARKPAAPSKAPAKKQAVKAPAKKTAAKKGTAKKVAGRRR